MKAIRKQKTTYERTNTYNDHIEETTRTLSYTETDDAGNILLDQSFNWEDDTKNTIRRTFDTHNRVLEEQFIDGDETEPYESRRYFYAEEGDDRIGHCEIRYLEDAVNETYHYDEEGRLVRKEIFYEDGSSYVEKECQWENGLLMEEKEFSDTNDLQSRKVFRYDENGRPVEIVCYEPEVDSSVVNKTTEVIHYGPFGIESQETYNISDQLVVRRRFHYNGQGQRTAVDIESDSVYFKHVYGYDAQGNCVLDQMLNKDGVILDEKRTVFDENNNEIRIDVYSKNIVDNTDELLLVESYTTEYQNL